MNTENIDIKNATIIDVRTPGEFMMGNVKGSKNIPLDEVSSRIEEFKSMITSSKKIAIIPGYGMAVAQAQFVVNEIISILKKKNIEVIFVIHPVA